MHFLNVHAGRIRSDTTLGPFFVTGDPSFAVAGASTGDDRHVICIKMIGTGSLLATVAYDSRMIRVWDALGRQSTGTCVQIFRQEVVNLRSLCSSRSLLFATANVSNRYRYDATKDGQRTLVGGLYEPRDVSVWALCPSLIPPINTSSTVTSNSSSSSSSNVSLMPSPIRSILKNPPTLVANDKDLTSFSNIKNQCFSDAPDLVVLPQSSLLVSSHYDGTINIWKYDDDNAVGQGEGAEGKPVAVHLCTFLISRDHLFEFRFLLASQTSPAVVYASNMTTLFAIDLSSLVASLLPMIRKR